MICRSWGFGCMFVSLLVLTACENPIIGDWDGKSPAIDNNMEVWDNNRGQATVHFTFEGSYYWADFNFDWEDLGDDKYEIDMECQGGCGDLDFTMECKLNDEGDELDCEGDSMWSEYEFEWEKDE